MLSENLILILWHYIKSMKRLLLLFFLLSFNNAISQNLIVNGNFEVFDTCPDELNQVHRTMSWVLANNSPDFYNCGWLGVIPQTFAYNGNGHIGMLGGNVASLSTIPYNEMIKSKLAAPMKKGVNYKVKFAIGLGVFYVPIDWIDFGIYFYPANKPLTYHGYVNECFPEVPQILISAMIVPQYNYSYLEFCFTPEVDMDSVLVGPFCNDLTQVAGPTALTYFMFDDFSVEEESSGELTIVASDTLFCDSGVVDFSSSTVFGSTVVSWIFEGGSPSSSIDPNPTGINYVDPGSFDVSVIVSSICGIDTITYSDYIKVKGDSSVLFAEDTVVVCNEASKKLSLLSNNYTSILWSNGSTNNEIEIAIPGIYSCIATTECDTIRDSIIVINEYCNCKVYLPNTFTPNEDGINDTFFPIGNFQMKEFKIFNRFGQEIFKTESDLGWDGKYENNKVPIGVYSYLLTYLNCNNKIVSERGVVRNIY